MRMSFVQTALIIVITFRGPALPPKTFAQKKQIQDPALLDAYILADKRMLIKLKNESNMDEFGKLAKQVKELTAISAELKLASAPALSNDSVRPLLFLFSN